MTALRGTGAKGAQEIHQHTAEMPCDGDLDGPIREKARKTRAEEDFESGGAADDALHRGDECHRIERLGERGAGAEEFGRVQKRSTVGA